MLERVVSKYDDAALINFVVNKHFIFLILITNKFKISNI